MCCPDLLLFNDFGGDWKRYEDALYRVFEQDILRHDLRFRGSKVTARRYPETQQRYAGYWHLVSTGHVEDDRLPDLRRCERLRWARWVIESCDTVSEIDIWENCRNNNRNILLWFREEYLVVLSVRGENYLLTTAYCTDKNHKIRKLRKERDQANAKP